jgi:cell division protein FtsL
VVDWLDGKAGIPLDAKDLKEVETALEGTRSWSADEQRLVTASREQRSSNRRWKRVFQGLGIAAVVMIAVSGAFAYWKNLQLNQKNLELTEQTTKAKQQTIFALSTSATSYSQIAENFTGLRKEPISIRS